MSKKISSTHLTHSQVNLKNLSALIVVLLILGFVISSKNLAGDLMGIGLILGLTIGPFAINFVHHTLLLLLLIFLRLEVFQKWIPKERRVLLISVLMYVVAYFIYWKLMQGCDKDCMTANSPLGSGAAWYTWFFLSHVLFMFPFTWLLNKLPTTILAILLILSLSVGGLFYLNQKRDAAEYQERVINVEMIE